MSSYVVKEQIYRNLKGEVAQIRCQMSDGDVLWWYNGHFNHEPKHISNQEIGKLLAARAQLAKKKI